jgi:hypothetical protein
VFSSFPLLPLSPDPCSGTFFTGPSPCPQYDLAPVRGVPRGMAGPPLSAGADLEPRPAPPSVRGSPPSLQLSPFSRAFLSQSAIRAGARLYPSDAIGFPGPPCRVGGSGGLVFSVVFFFVLRSLVPNLYSRLQMYFPPSTVPRPPGRDPCHLFPLSASLTTSPHRVCRCYRVDHTILGGLLPAPAFGCAWSLVFFVYILFFF